jgi:hypothetical protein
MRSLALVLAGGGRSSALAPATGLRPGKAHLATGRPSTSTCLIGQRSERTLACLIADAAVRDALVPFTGAQGRVSLPGWYRVVLARV